MTMVMKKYLQPEEKKESERKLSVALSLCPKSLPTKDKTAVTRNSNYPNTIYKDPNGSYESSECSCSGMHIVYHPRCIVF